MNTIFTIGHSQHNIEHFISLLRMYDINCVIDVRSTPYSKYAETFNRERINEELSRNGIRYFFMGEYFGARQSKKELYTQDGYLDFERVQKEPTFIKGIQNVMLGIEQGNRVALMCTEKDPMDCHRAIMVSKSFADNGVSIHHILEDGSIQTQEELENRMLEKYYPERNQLSIFTYGNEESEQELVQRCYKKRNEEIGYRYMEGM